MADHALDVGPLGEVTCVAGESFVVSGPTGDIEPGSDQGVYVRDTRFLHLLRLTVDGERPRHLAGRSTAVGRASFHAYVPRSDDRGVDPTLLVTRHRIVDGSLHEGFTFENRAPLARTVVVELWCGTDFAYIFDVKHRRQLPAAVAEPAAGMLRFLRDSESVRVVPTGDHEIHDDRIRWVLELGPRSSERTCVDVVVSDVYGTVGPASDCSVSPSAPTPAPADRSRIRSSDIRLTRLVRRSFEDLRSLQLVDPEHPADRFCAAGTPWYLTLFGRDALWAAFMSLPHDLGLAGGTLRTLARRQGRVVDPETEEAPGKILHEVRRGSLVHRGDLPPNYYGTIDATPLFAILLHEAWSWGLPPAEVEALLPNLEAALRWIVEHGDPLGDGFVRYRRQGGRGLENQGWKDSHDGIQFADGRLAEAPIALVEVQAYAYEAAMRGAAVLEWAGRDGTPWRAWAAELRHRFRERFWLTDEHGPFLAVALDADGTPVDSVTSNMGHVLTTGILSGEEAAAIARRLADPTMTSGWGLRTLSTASAGFNPLSYHGGSVWPHDTAIAAYGAALAGARDVAAPLIRGLVAAGRHFDDRLPELFAGTAREPGSFPVPYPAACRPQAWSSAAVLLLLRACLRPEPAVPDGVVTLSPLWPPVFRHLELSGVPLAGGTIDVRVSAIDGVEVDVHGTDVRLEVTRPVVHAT